MDRTYNSTEYPFNGHLSYHDEDRYNRDEFSNNISSSIDYNTPEYPSQVDQFYQLRPRSRNASDFSNGYFNGTQHFNQGFQPTDAASNLSEEVNPLDERFSERSFAPSLRNHHPVAPMMPVIPERSMSRNSNRQMYIDQGDSWTQHQGSFPMNEPPSNLNNSYKPQSILNKSHSSNQFALDSSSRLLRKPELTEVIEFLRQKSDAAKANAAAYLQHLSYMDDDVKNQTRVLGGIPPLLDLVDHPQLEVHRAACGALRNLSYGKVNDENKKEIKNNGGITTLVRLIRRTSDQETLELVTGIVWNLSSCLELKKPIIDEGLKALLDQIIRPHSRGSQERQMDVPSYRSIAFRNASGILRNVSSEGDFARKKMRECEGLIGSLVAVVHQSLANDDCDNKSIENCVCVLRNLSFACQEVSDPEYVKKKKTKTTNLDDRDPKTGCFGNKSKSTNKLKKNSTSLPTFDPTKHPNASEMSKLWSPEIIDLYLPLLKHCTNPDTLEATAGAIQNLVACDWQPSKNLREIVRNRKGIDIIIGLLRDSPDKVVCSASRCLRNLALDEKCRDLIGKHAMESLVADLPSPASSRPPSDDTSLAVLSTLYEVVKSNSSFARVFIDVQGINKLMSVTKSPPGSFDERVVRYSQQLLQKIWKYNELHDELKKNGWTQNDFTFSNTSGGTWNRSSAENTINRPIATQEKPRTYNDYNNGSFNRPGVRTGVEDASNQNSLVRPHSSYSLNRRNDDDDDEYPLDALHAMQLEDRTAAQQHNGTNSWSDRLDRYDVEGTRGQRVHFGRDGRNADAYYVPGDFRPNSSIGTLDDGGASPHQLHLRSEPLVSKNDSWI